MFGLFLIPVAIITTALLLEPSPDPVAERIILLPGDDGRVGAVTVTGATGTRTLDSAYAAMDITTTGQLAPSQESAESVNDRYGKLLHATPPARESFELYFESGSSDQLTPASLQKLSQLQAILEKRPAPEISVVGHTDTVGDAAQNDRLSLDRARTVLQIIEKAGVSAVSIEASGRGERELLIATEDRVDEPRNRRVQITIR